MSIPTVYVRAAALLGLSCVLCVCSRNAAAQSPVTLKDDAATYILDNGIVTVRVAKASGDLVSLRYKDMEMLGTFVDSLGLPDLQKDPPGEMKTGLNRTMTDHQYGFWSHDAMGVRGSGDAIPSVTIDPKTNNGERAEVSVKGIAANGRGLGTGPGAKANGDFIADIELRWALGKGDSGVYTYCQFDHKSDYSFTSITEARFCAKLADMFDWMSAGDKYNKAYPKQRGEDKYSYTTVQSQTPAFGWSSSTKQVGFYLINPSMEYMSGGPTKPEFLGHRDTNAVGAPCVLNYWRSSHYGGADVTVGRGEQWTKIIGPFMLFVNSGKEPLELYKEANEQAKKEAAKWPFDWVSGVDYAKKSERSTVSGQLVLSDPQAPNAKLPNLQVGLTHAAFNVPTAMGAPGRLIDWQNDAKFYQFWNRGKDDGTFAIPNVRAGQYTLRAFADGVLGEFAQANVTVEQGKPLDLGKITWTPVRKGKQLWDIGIPNRNGSEFFKAESYAVVGIGAQYATLFPQDITYVIGKSDFSKDWFFQHVPRTGRATPYAVSFDMPSAPKGKATLRFAICGGAPGSIGVAVNDQNAGQVTRLTNDGVLSRHQIQGMWYEREVAFDASLMKQGANVLKLTVPAGAATAGVIYDYIRLELDEGAAGR